MTDNIKVILRPKVRFSDNARNKEIVEHCERQTVEQMNGPRIKEIISVKNPIRVVDPTKSIVIQDKEDKDVSLSDRNFDFDIDTSASHYGTTSGNVQNTSFSDEEVAKGQKVERTMILHDTNVIQKKNYIEKSCKMSQLDKNSRDIAKDCWLRQKGKENKGIPLRNTISKDKNVNVTRTGNSHVQSITQKKNQFSTSANCMKKINVRPVFNNKEPEMTKSQFIPSIMKRTRHSMIQGGILNTKPITIRSRVTSRYKTVTKNKISPVKIVLCDLLDPKIFVGPGVFRKEQDDAKIRDANEKCIITSDVTIEDLVQPEYNSIVCTINKLKELEQQKIITDVSHLPSMLKSFVNEKISTALDFPLDEVIYKNLVDLSIDERQLPSTIARSKDPEPRQKDIVPKLSDFFIPEDTKDICEAVNVNSRTSKIYDNWNAFRVSDRILEWKYSIDDIY